MTVSGYDDLKICNGALSLIGLAPINSLTLPTTGPETTCALHLPLVTGMLLSRHDWNFANPVRQLANNAEETPVGGYAYAFAFPSDLIAGPFAVYSGDDPDRPRSDYINANNHIHTNIEDCRVRYRKRTSPEGWPIYFIDLVTVVLASRLAKPLTDDGDRASELRIQAFGRDEESAAGGLFGAAKAADGMAQPVKSLFRNGDPLTSLVY